jgi:hypothetical protein
LEGCPRDLHAKGIQKDDSTIHAPIYSACQPVDQRRVRIGFDDRNATSIAVFCLKPAQIGNATRIALDEEIPVEWVDIQVVAPDFYASVWNESITKQALAMAAGWMGIGNIIMYRLVNFRI